MRTKFIFCSRITLLFFLLLSTKVKAQQTWNFVGNPNFTSANVSYLTIANDGKVPYVAFQDDLVGKKATVNKFSNGSWQTVGRAGFTENQVAFTRIAISPTGVPFIAFRNENISASGKIKQGISVMKYNNIENKWEYVGTTIAEPCFSAGKVSNIDMTFDENSTPYVVYEDWMPVSYKGSPTVQKFSGTKWELVGSAGFIGANNTAQRPRIKINNGLPYVLFEDGSNSNKLSLFKFENGSWRTVITGSGFITGDNGPSATTKNISSQDLIFFNNIPYITYNVDITNSKTYVTNYTTSWITTQPIITGLAKNMLAVVDGTLYSVNYSGGKFEVYKLENNSWIKIETTINATMPLMTEKSLFDVTVIGKCIYVSYYNGVIGNSSSSIVEVTGSGKANVIRLCVGCGSNNIKNDVATTCQPNYNWRGDVYNKSGVYIKTIASTDGCDSTIILNLTINSPSQSNTSISICSNQLPYTWNKNSYTIGGIYTVHLTNAAGCDSAATLNLFVKAAFTSTSNLSICQSALPYIWNKNSYIIGGTYTVHLINSAGCDSAATLNLSVKAASTSTNSLSICPNQLPYTWNKNSYTEGGTFIVHLTNAAGCDSAATLQLTINSLPIIVKQTLDTVICSQSLTNSIIPISVQMNNSNNYNYKWQWQLPGSNWENIYDGSVQFITGTYTTQRLLIDVSQQAFQNLTKFRCIISDNADCKVTSNSCQVRLITVDSSIIIKSVCDSLSWNGVNYKVGGKYYKTFPKGSIWGCDSVATLNLTIKAASKSSTSLLICPSSLPYIWNKNSYTRGGTYTVHLTNAAGCDSAATLNLTVISVTNSSISKIACGSYTWNGTIYTANGTYTKTFKNAAGCDSVVTLLLTITQLPSINVVGSSQDPPPGEVKLCNTSGNLTLRSSSQNQNQWFRNGLLITGATNQNFSPTTSGVYCVAVVPCETKSNCITVTVADPLNITILSDLPSGAGICIGSSIKLSAQLSGGIWSSNNNTIATIDPNTGEITTKTGGTVIFTYKVSKDNCDYTQNYALTIDNTTIPSPTIDVKCDQIQYGHYIELCPLNFVFSNYQWYKNGTALSNSVGTCIKIFDSDLGNYQFTGSNSINGGKVCWSKKSVGVSITEILNKKPPCTKP